MEAPVGKSKSKMGCCQIKIIKIFKIVLDFSLENFAYIEMLYRNDNFRTTYAMNPYFGLKGLCDLNGLFWKEFI